MTSLCVIDVQNDFCHPDGVFAKSFGLDISGVDLVVSHIEKLIDNWRKRGGKIIWTQAMGDPSYLSATQLERYRNSGKLGFLREGAWGVDFYRVSPKSNELVFKKGGYDAFSNYQFREYLLHEKEVILIGFFSDVCLNATAQTADSLGLKTSLVRECSLSMFYSYEDSLGFMQRYFGTRILSIQDFGA